MKTPTLIQIHHTAVSYDKNPDQFIANNNYHKSTNAQYAKTWSAYKSSLGYYLGYNYEIAKNGKLYKAREDGETTAACYQKNMNDGRCIHIALDGNFDIEKPNPPQIYALRDLLQKLVLKYAIKRDNIVFHNMYANKSCPGGNLDLEFVRDLAGNAALPDVKKKDQENKKEKLTKLLEEVLKLIKEL